MQPLIDGRDRVLSSENIIFSDDSFCDNEASPILPIAIMSACSGALIGILLSGYIQLALGILVAVMGGIFFGWIARGMAERFLMTTEKVISSDFQGIHITDSNREE